MIMGDGKILGATTVSDRWRISLIKDVREVLEEQGHDVEIGDRILYKIEDGQIVIGPDYDY